MAVDWICWKPPEIGEGTQSLANDVTMALPMPFGISLQVQERPVYFAGATLHNYLVKMNNSEALLTKTTGGCTRSICLWGKSRKVVCGSIMPFG